MKFRCERDTLAEAVATAQRARLALPEAREHQRDAGKARGAFIGRGGDFGEDGHV